MKRYIRLKDDKFYDTTNYKQEIEQLLKLHLTEELDSFLNKEDIIIESDNILDLIQVGDLVKYEFPHYDSVEDDKEDHYFNWKNSNKDHRDKDLVTQLYTKQGDNYILVWDKERGVI